MPVDNFNTLGDFDLDAAEAKVAPPAKPDLPAANADATADGVTLEIKDVLGIVGADDEDGVVWGELPGAKPVQPEDGIFDPPSKDEIQLPQ